MTGVISAIKSLSKERKVLFIWIPKDRPYGRQDTPDIKKRSGKKNILLHVIEERATINGSDIQDLSVKNFLNIAHNVRLLRSCWREGMMLALVYKNILFSLGRTYFGRRSVEWNLFFPCQPFHCTTARACCALMMF